MASSRSFTLLGVLFGLWYLLESIPLVKGDDKFCHSDQPHAIFAADNLQNGTIRLYSQMHYWNLELFHYEPVKDHSTSWWSPFSKLFSSKPPAPSLFLETNDLQLAAHIHDHFRDERLTASAYQGLNFALYDTRSLHRTMVSLSDLHNIEYTFLFETGVLANRTDDEADSARFCFWDTATGKFVDRFHVVDESTVSKAIYDNSTQQKSFLISGAFRVYLNNTQHLFFIVNNLFYFAKDLKLDSFLSSTKSTANHIQPEYDQYKRFHRGRIPQPISAVFVLQISADRIWIVLIQCSHYCLVPWEASQGYFDFDQCASSPSWKQLDSFFSSSGNVYQNMAPFRNYVVLNNYSITMQSVDNATSSVWHNFSITRFSQKFGSLFVNPQDKQVNWKFLTSVGLTTAIVMLFACLVISMYLGYRKTRGDSYHLAKKEAKATKAFRKQSSLEKVDFVQQIHQRQGGTSGYGSNLEEEHLNSSEEMPLDQQAHVEMHVDMEETENKLPLEASNQEMESQV